MRRRDCNIHVKHCHEHLRFGAFYYAGTVSHGRSSDTGTLNHATPRAHPPINPLLLRCVDRLFRAEDNHQNRSGPWSLLCRLNESLNHCRETLLNFGANILEF